MSKRGFTLAELLAVISILGIIALIVFPHVNTSIKNSKKRAYDQQIESILTSAETWGLKNMAKLSETSENYITIETLQKSGYLGLQKIINPITDEEMNGCIVARYQNYQYIYSYTEESCDELQAIPVITLNGENTVVVGINETYVDEGATALYLEEDITKYIQVNNNVDTSKEGSYEVRYNVTYGDIKAVEVVRTVIVMERNPVIVLSPNEMNSYTKSVTVNVNATVFKGNTISSMTYKLNGGDVQNVSNDQIILDMDGEYSIEVTVVDNEGNTSTVTSGIYKIDNSDPIIAFPEGENGLTISKDEVLQYDLREGITLSDTTATVSDMEVSGNLSAIVGYYTVKYTVTDLVGNTVYKIRKIYVTDNTIASDGIFITEVKYKGDIGANIENSQVQAYQTTLDGSIGLSNSNIDSEITLTITVLNNTDSNYQLLEIVNSEDSTINNIHYSISGLDSNSVIDALDSITFDMTFQYDDDVDLSQINELYDVSLNFDFREILSISYEYITNNGYPTTVLKGTDFVLDFVDHIPEGIYIKNTNNYSYENPKLTVRNVQSDMVISNTLAYSYAGTYTFNGTNYIDTGVKLFNKENFDRNFEVLFTVSSYDSTQERFGTVFNSIDEINENYPGVVFRANSGSTSFELVSNNKTNGFLQGQEVPSFASIKKVRILRIDDIIYYSFNDGDHFEFQNFSVFNEYFDIPATFGASLDDNGDPWRYFKGAISNMQVRFLDDNIDVDSYINPYYIAYRPTESSSLVLDGTNYINTGVKLFDEENANKDFRIRFTVSSPSETQDTYATIVNSMNENDTDYPGVTFRINNKTFTQYQIVANGDTKLNGTFEVADVKNVEILREDGILYYKINDGNYVQFQDLTAFKNYFNVPVTFGASLDADGNPYRYFVGTISKFDISVR